MTGSSVSRHLEWEMEWYTELSKTPAEIFLWSGWNKVYFLKAWQQTSLYKNKSKLDEKTVQEGWQFY